MRVIYVHDLFWGEKLIAKIAVACCGRSRILLAIFQKPPGA
jgi:hypothetical protein